MQAVWQTLSHSQGYTYVSVTCSSLTHWPAAWPLRSVRQDYSRPGWWQSASQNGQDHFSSRRLSYVRMLQPMDRDEIMDQPQRDKVSKTSASLPGFSSASWAGHGEVSLEVEVCRSRKSPIRQTNGYPFRGQQKFHNLSVVQTGQFTHSRSSHISVHYASISLIALFSERMLEADIPLTCPGFGQLNKMHFRVAKALCFTLSLMIAVGWLLWKTKSLVDIFNLFWDHWVLAKRESQGTTADFPLYLELPVQQVLGFYWARHHLVLVSSACPRFKRIQCCSLAIVIAHSWYIQVLENCIGLEEHLGLREAMSNERGNGLALGRNIWNNSSWALPSPLCFQSCHSAEDW